MTHHSFLQRSHYEQQDLHRQIHRRRPPLLHHTPQAQVIHAESPCLPPRVFGFVSKILPGGFALGNNPNSTRIKNRSLDDRIKPSNTGDHMFKYKKSITTAIALVAAGLLAKFVVFRNTEA